MDVTGQSLSNEATLAGKGFNRRPAPDMSLGDERTCGDRLGDQDAQIDGIEVVDLEARYRVEKTLGRGGMGEVLLALDTRLDRKVAIKRILGEAARSKTAVARFLTEAKAIAALNHPNIVQIYDYGRAKDGPFLIMEFVDGSSLLDRCRDGALPLEKAIDLACQLCDGLAKAHDIGIIHRDIKPANVLLTKDGMPKLTDFGLAKSQASDHGQTVTGAVLGTPDFMPPEQRRDASEVDHRSDLWSLAATLYQMVTGRSPKIIRFDLLPPHITKALGKALEDSQDARYQTARELRDALKTSLRAAESVFEVVAVGDKCPYCGEHNQSGRNFCRGCGGALVIPCLACRKPLPIWENICGDCGGKQSTLVNERRAAMAARQAEAEGLLGDFEFERAASVATSLRDEPDPRLHQLREWAVAFLETIEKTRSQQRDRLAESLDEARSHELAYDYLSAIFTLEFIPRTFHDERLPGREQTVTEMLVRVKAKQAEVNRLYEAIRDKVATEHPAILLKLVARLLELEPGRVDMLRLRDRLENRLIQIKQSQEAAVATVEKLLADHNYDAAAAALADAEGTPAAPELERFRARIDEARKQLRELASSIKIAVKSRRYEGLLTDIDAYLQLKPRDPAMQKLRESVVIARERAAERLRLAQTEAQAAWANCDFTAAAAALRRLPEHERTAAINDELMSCTRFAESQTRAISEAQAALSKGDAAVALGEIARHEALLLEHQLTDETLAALKERCHVAARVARRRRNRLFAGITACAALFLAIASIWLVQRAAAAHRDQRINAALEGKLWDEALIIDPGHPRALLGRALERLRSETPDLETVRRDIEAAARSSQTTLPREVAAGRAMLAAVEALRQTNQTGLDEAERALQSAITVGSDAEMISFASHALGEAWLRRAEAAVASRRTAGVAEACAAAERHGVAMERLKRILAEASRLEGEAAVRDGDYERAVRLLIAARDTQNLPGISGRIEEIQGLLAKEVNAKKKAEAIARVETAVVAFETTRTVGNLKAVVERLQSFPVDDSPKVRDWQSRVSKAAESEAQTLLEKGEIVSAVTLFANAWNLHKDAAGPPDTDFTRSVVKAAQTRFNICVANRQFAEAQSIETAIALLEPDAIQWWIPALLKLPRDAWGDVPRSVLSKLKLNE